jgi:hypothetical protein
MKSAPFSILTPCQGSISHLDTIPTIPAGQAPRGTYFEIQHYSDACWYVKNHYSDPTLVCGSSTISITDESGDFLSSHFLDHLIYRLKRSPTADCFLALTFDLRLYSHDVDFARNIHSDVSRGIPDRYHIQCVDLSEAGNYFVFSNWDSLVYLDRQLRHIGNWHIPDHFDRHHSAATPEIQRALRVLGLPKNPALEQTKAAYRRLLLKVHPDINREDPNASEKTRAVVEAYEVLTRGLVLDSANGLEDFGGLVRISMPTIGDSITSTESKAGTPDLYVGCYSGKVYLVGPRGSVALVYDTHAGVRRIKQSGRYLYVVSHDFCDILDNGTLVNRVAGNFGFDRTIFESSCNAILVTHKLLRLYSLGGIPFGEIAFKDNVADAFMRHGRLRVITGQKSYNFAIEPPADYRALDLNGRYLAA